VCYMTQKLMIFNFFLISCNTWRVPARYHRKKKVKSDVGHFEKRNAHICRHFLVWKALQVLLHSISIPPNALQIWVEVFTFRGPEWTGTHQCTIVDGWCIDGCTFFVPPYPLANQGGELKLPPFFLFCSLIKLNN